MNELNERLSSGAESIWGKFCRAVSECDLKWAVVLPAAIGALTIVAGVVQEAHGQTDLIIQGGRAAVDAYKASHQANPLTIPQIVIEAFSPGGRDMGFGAVSYTHLTLPMNREV